MADKISTLALNVDLDCHPCYEKMRKALCKFPEIESQNFDEEQKKVIISGPFEPEKLIKKLCCKVECKIIKGYVIILPLKLEQPPPPPPPPSKPVNIVIGPIGPVCSHTPFQLPDYSIPVDCNSKLRNPTCHCNGSRGNCQCGCGGYFHSHGSQGNCQYGCGGHSPSRGSQGNCQCGCGGHFPSCGSQGNCQCGCGGHFPSCGSQGNCQCGCRGQSDCRFLIEEEKGCTIM